MLRIKTYAKVAPIGASSGRVITTSRVLGSPADKIIPLDMPNFILRGARLVTQITFLPIKSQGS